MAENRSKKSVSSAGSAMNKIFSFFKFISIRLRQPFYRSTNGEKRCFRAVPSTCLFIVL